MLEYTHKNMWYSSSLETYASHKKCKSYTVYMCAVSRDSLHCVPICFNPHLQSLWSLVSTVTRCQIQSYTLVTLPFFAQMLLIVCILSIWEQKKKVSFCLVLFSGVCCADSNILSTEVSFFFFFFFLFFPWWLRFHLMSCQRIGQEDCAIKHVYTLSPSGQHPNLTRLQKYHYPVRVIETDIQPLASQFVSISDRITQNVQL